MSDVIIGDIIPYTQATAILNQTIFMTNWTANVASDVVVYQTPVGSPPNDQTQKLAYPAQYSVAFIGALQQVQVTLVTPAGAGDIVTVIRNTPADRTNLYTNTNFTPTMLNNDFGILTLVDQQAQLVNQLVAPRYNYSAVIAPNMLFPNANIILPLLGANQVWMMNSTVTQILAVPFNGGGGGGGGVNPGLINNLAWYAATGNQVSGLPTLPFGLLQTNGSGAPSINQAPFIFQDPLGNVVTTFSSVGAGAVNYIGFQNNVTGFPASLITFGTGPAVELDLAVKGGTVSIRDATLTNSGKLRFYNAGNNQYTGLTIATLQATSVDFVLPAVDGTSQAPLVTDGSGNLSFLPGAWVDFSGTVGATGFTGALTITKAVYKKIGKTVFINLNLSGTSNATSFTVTNLPFSAGNITGMPFNIGLDNSANVIASGIISGTTLQLLFGASSVAAGWTNSGTKGIATSFFYETT